MRVKKRTCHHLFWYWQWVDILFEEEFLYSLFIHLLLWLIMVSQFINRVLFGLWIKKFEITVAVFSNDTFMPWMLKESLVKTQMRILLQKLFQPVMTYPMSQSRAWTTDDVALADIPPHYCAFLFSFFFCYSRLATLLH